MKKITIEDNTIECCGFTYCEQCGGCDSRSFNIELEDKAFEELMEDFDMFLLKYDRQKLSEWIDFDEKRLSNCNVVNTDVNPRIYAFMYNGCIHESSWTTISLHYTKEGAEKAMLEHKQKALDEFNETYANDNEFGFKFGEYEDWCVKQFGVLP